MEKEVNIKIEGKEWEEALDKAFNKVIKEVKIDGFRPGKAPKEVFLKRYGIGSLFNDAIEFCIDNAYQKMLEENKDITIVAEPQLSINSVTEIGVEFKFLLTLRPEVKLGKYTDLGVKKESNKVTKKEIDEAIENMRSRYMENIDKDGKVEMNDIAVIDFEGFKDGVPFKGGKGENYSLKIGSQTFIPGFEEQLVGMDKGEEKDINVKFPEDYQAEDLKGKEVTFKVKVNEIKTQKLPELNEDFFEDLNMDGVTSIESLEAQVKENLMAHKENENENKYIDELLEAAGKNTKVEIPKAMIDDETHRMVHQYEDNLKMQGLTLEQFYKFTNSNEEALREQMKEEASKRVLYRLMLEEIAKKEKIEISDEEADKEATTLATKYQMEKEEFLKLFGGIEMVKYDLEMRKAIEVLKK